MNNVYLYLNLFFELLVIIFTILAYRLWYKHGREKYSPAVVTFHPPEDLNCLQVAAVFEDGILSINDLPTLIIYLATKGYIKFKINDIGRIKDDCIIYKLKDYDGTNEFEKRLIDTIFYSSQKCISLHDLNQKLTFRHECHKIVSDLNDEIGKEFFEKNISNTLKMYGIWSILFFFSLLSVTNFSTFYFILFFFVSNFFCTACLLMFRNKLKIPKYMFTLAFYAISLIATTENRLVSHEYLYIIYINLICFFIASICFANMRKKNDRGKKIYQQILGFKKFFDLTDRKKFEILAKEKQEEYYQILPYAIIFGKNLAFIKFFKTPPSWWEGKFDSYKLSCLLFHLDNIISGKNK